MSNVVYHYHPVTKAFVGQSLSDESPLDPGIFLMPANATTVQPPVTAANEIAVFGDGVWSTTPDFRGQSYWLNGAEIKIDSLGESPPAGSTPDKPAATLAEINTALMADVDAQISNIYSRFTRFETEYIQREAAARAFKAGGYLGDAGLWVMAFATNAGLSAQAATDLIISQADSMRAALLALGALRMGKYGIAAAVSEAAAQAVHDDIIAQASAIAAAL